MLGGKAFGMFAFLNLKRAIARAYCSPRKTSSASFSRRASWRQTGIAIVSRIAMMASAISSAAIA